ncbi:hypothetical protein AQUCO_00100841v1 [Aquilegia coerulea]|nr:hypothetical protein AQUCO_00100841v1 [Aquilegia coerulea]
MHAVVLLYNYYHRKQFPELEFLDYKSFCKVSVNAKPSLIAFFQDIENFNDDGLNENLSITEKALMNACKISLELDITKAAPSMERWPTSKVAVFLMDSRQEKCSLYFGDMTEGVWSLIEKPDAERAKKRPGRILISDESRLRQLAVSAVKEKTDINQTDLVILGSHVAYSLSEEKTTARLFIMKCKSVNKDLFEVPIKDVIDRKVSGNGSVHQEGENISNNTKISSPISAKRMTILPTGKSEGSSGTCPNSDLLVPKTSSEKVDQKENDNYDLSRNQNIGEIKSSKRGRTPSIIDDTESDIRSTKSCSAVKDTTEKIVESSGTFKTADFPVFKAKSTENLDAKENGEDHVSKCHDIDESKSPNFSGPIEERKTDPQSDNDTNSGTAVKVTQEKIEGSSGTCQTADFPVLETKTTENLDANENDNYHVSKFHDLDEVRSSRIPLKVSVDHTVTASGLITTPRSSVVKDYGKIQAMLALKAGEISRASLKALSMKRNELCLQQRHLEDEIARCEKKVQSVLSGGEDDLMLKIESIIEACYVACGRGVTGTQEEHSPKGIKRKRLSEAILTLQNP